MRACDDRRQDASACHRPSRAESTSRPGTQRRCPSVPSVAPLCARLVAVAHSYRQPALGSTQPHRRCNHRSASPWPILCASLMAKNHSLLRPQPANCNRSHHHPLIHSHVRHRKSHHMHMLMIERLHIPWMDHALSGRCSHLLRHPNSGGRTIGRLLVGARCSVRACQPCTEKRCAPASVHTHTHTDQLTH